MGTCTSCPSAEHFNSLDRLQKNLHLALVLQKIELTPEDHSLVGTFISKSSHLVEWHGKTILDFSPQRQLQLRKSRNQELNEISLVAELLNPRNEHGQKVEGAVAYERGFYLGQIEQGVPHGNGELYFSEENSWEVQVSGSWHQGSAVAVWIEKKGGQRFWLEIESCNNAKLTFPGAESVGETTYQGTIANPNRERINLLKEIITGKGVLSFPNGDRYQGGVNNGLMHTESGETARYRERQTSTTYVGPFREGKRHGQGVLEVLLKSKPEEEFGCETCVIKVSYADGVLTGSSEEYLVEAIGRTHA